VPDNGHGSHTVTAESHPQTREPPERSFPLPAPRAAPAKASSWDLAAGWVAGHRLATVAILLGCAMAVWFGLASTVGKASWTTMSYRVIDDRTVDVTYRVSRPAGSTVTCLVSAMDRGFATVGQVEVRVPGSQTSSVERTTRIRTTTRAVTGVVKSCSVI
jgi:Domain of unknown function (DUF4307)